MIFSISSANVWFLCLPIDAVIFQMHLGLCISGCKIRYSWGIHAEYSYYVLPDCKSNEGNGSTVTCCISGLRCPQVAGQASSVRVVTNEVGSGIGEFFQDGVLNNFTSDAHCDLGLFHPGFSASSRWLIGYIIHPTKSWNLVLFSYRLYTFLFSAQGILIDNFFAFAACPIVLSLFMLAESLPPCRPVRASCQDRCHR